MTRRVRVARPQVGPEEIAAVSRVLASGHFVAGQEVAAFERDFADAVGVSHAVAVSSGTAALHAALFALDLQPGDEVVVPALTFFSTVTAVMHVGGVPVFADVTRDRHCLCPEDLERRLTPRTRAVLPVHLYGHVADLPRIRAVAEAAGLFVVEDCAQAHGSRLDGISAGALADLGAFSFFATKHLTTGEGGMVTTERGDWAERVRRFRSHGLVGRSQHVLLGYNYRMTEMAAAMGRVQLGRLEPLNQARIRRSEQLIEALADVPWLEPPRVPAGVVHSYFWCHFTVDEARLGMKTPDLVRALSDRGVETRYRYVEPLYRQPLLTTELPALLRRLAGPNLPDYGSLHLPNTEALAGRVIGLPNRPDLTDEELGHVVEAVRAMG